MATPETIRHVIIGRHFSLNIQTSLSFSNVRNKSTGIDRAQEWEGSRDNRIQQTIEK